MSYAAYNTLWMPSLSATFGDITMTMIKMTGMIESIDRGTTGGTIRVVLSARGAVEAAKSPDAKEASFKGEILLKPLVGNDLTFGDKLYVTVSTTEP